MRYAKIATLLVAFLWGSSFAFQKGILEIVDPVRFTFYNFLVTGLFFLAYALYKKKDLLYRWKEGFLLGVLVTGMELTQMYGLHLSTAANTSFISNLGMLFIPYFGYFIFKHKVTKMDSLALVGAGIGMYFLVGGIAGVSYGDIFLLASAFFMAFYFLMSQRYEGENNGHLSVLCAQQFLTVGLVTGMYMLFSQDTFTIPLSILNNFIILIIIFTTLPYLLIQWSSKYTNEMTVSMYDGVVEPLVGGIVAWAIFYESTTTSQVFGGLGMVLCFAISALYTQKHALLKQAKK